MFKKEAYRIAETYLYQFKQDIPVLKKEAYSYQKKMLLSMIDRFADYEWQQKKAGQEVFALELSFGDSKVKQKGDYSFSQVVPLALTENKTIYVSGSIDRVDRLKNGQYFILDYKTGSVRQQKTKEKFRQGRQLQPFFYAMVFEQLFADKNTVEKTGYFYINDKEDLQCVTFFYDDKEQLKHILYLLTQAINKGQFVIKKGLDGVKSPCSYCSSRQACTIYNTSTIDEKFDNHKDIALKEISLLLDIK